MVEQLRLFEEEGEDDIDLVLWHEVKRSRSCVFVSAGLRPPPHIRIRSSLVVGRMIVHGRMLQDQVFVQVNTEFSIPPRKTVPTPASAYHHKLVASN